ncbi:hypothetical protein L6164_003343 [Bauhinia variegata]|uniref:Uncharacterized protein n=1 Tax=Bauhinia variegata TaxID=167791 RepID=A0ACB9Q108_BAUVA|nr:hypothetical protein L6164_003343 [Bauhinia variegata]
MANATLSCSLNTTETLKSCTPSKPSNPSSISKVRVVVRVRPFLPQEISARNGNPVPCISILDQDLESPEEVAVYLKDTETSRKECYQLDSFYGSEDNNVGEIFLREVSTFIPAILNGCNASVFAYGATGSGKTYTMQGTEEHPGLMPLAVSMVLSICQSTGRTAHISYYEVYMDRGLFLRVQRRKVAHTGLNDVSSSSHGVVVISVSTPSSDGTAATVSGKLNLIDLAGNEDNRRTCNEGIRLQESAKINQSLFALSNVIFTLNKKQPRVLY